MTHLRSYIRVYDNALDDLKIDEIYKEVASKLTASEVDVDGVMRYHHIPITPAAETRAQWLMLSYNFTNHLTQYKMDIGIQHEPRWSEDVMESFTFRRYPGVKGFQSNMFDARSQTTSPLFVSGFYFLTDSPEFRLEFDHSVAAYGPVAARKGRLVIFPSSWLFPYSLRPCPDDVDVIKASMRWYDRT